MPTRLNPVRYLTGAAGHETDAELLGRFVDRHDEAAFALLVRRHGAMVYGVCRRLLPEHDAEDAYQATFLVLAEKARTAAPREVANWLHGVARKAALLSRRSIARRRERTGEVPERPARPDEVRSILDEELGRLPDAYRIVIVLCDLEGRTRREAAAILGWPEGTVAGRLVRAREMLAKRLAPSVSIAALLAGTASARVPEVLTPTATIPTGIAALSREVMGVMTRGKLMKTTAAVLLLGCAGFGMVLQAGPNTSAPSPDGPVLTGSPEVLVTPRAADVVWGKEVDGLQAGLSAVVRTCRQGERVKLKVRLRNVGKDDITIRYVLLKEHAPAVTDAKGVRMTVAMPPSPRYYVPPTERVIKPGETVGLYDPEVAVESEDRARLLGELRVQTPTTYVAPGTYDVSFGGMLTSHPKLTTGAVGVEVREPAKQEAFVWGKAVDGLQAGVGPTRNAYRAGETVTMAVKLRNVGTAPVAYTYLLTPFQYVVPTVHDSAGKPVRVDRQADVFYAAVPTKATLKPGEEVTLGPTGKAAELPLSKVPGWYPVFVLAPAADGDLPVAHAAPGKYTVSYAGLLQSHPTLATGFTGFEVKDTLPADTRAKLVAKHRFRRPANRILPTGSASAGESGRG